MTHKIVSDHRANKHNIPIGTKVLLSEPTKRGRDGFMAEILSIDNKQYNYKIHSYLFRDEYRPLSCIKL